MLSDTGVDVNLAGISHRDAGLVQVCQGTEATAEGPTPPLLLLDCW